MSCVVEYRMRKQETKLEELVFFRADLCIYIYEVYTYILFTPEDLKRARANCIFVYNNTSGVGKSIYIM